MTSKTNSYALYLCKDDLRPVFLMFGTRAMFTLLAQNLGCSVQQGYLINGTSLIGIRADDAATVDLTSPASFQEPLLVHNFS